MVYRTRIKYTATQKSDIWDRWQHGESLTSIGRLFDRPSSLVSLIGPGSGRDLPFTKTNGADPWLSGVR